MLGVKDGNRAAGGGRRRNAGSNSRGVREGRRGKCEPPTAGHLLSSFQHYHERPLRVFARKEEKKNKIKIIRTARLVSRFTAGPSGGR